MTAGPLRIDSNLTFSVDGPSGSSTGRVDACGTKVTISVTDPVILLRSALGNKSHFPAVVGDLLAEAGVTVEVVHPQGPVVTVGAGVDSAVGALLSGTRHLRLGSLRAAAPLARARLVPPSAQVHRPFDGRCCLAARADNRRSMAQTSAPLSLTCSTSSPTQGQHGQVGALLGLTLAGGRGGQFEAGGVQP